MFLYVLVSPGICFNGAKADGGPRDVHSAGVQYTAAADGRDHGPPAGGAAEDGAQDLVRGREIDPLLLSAAFGHKIPL